MSKLAVHVRYCGGWGYKRFYDKLVIALDDKFPDQLEYSFTMDPGATGNFEVTIGKDKTLIHSKTTRGQGRCESKDELDALFAQIEAAL